MTTGGTLKHERIMIKAKPQGLSLCLYTLLSLLVHSVETDDGLLNDLTWAQQMDLHNNQLDSGSSEYKDNEDFKKWVLEEEHILTSHSKVPHRTAQHNTQSEMWWKVTSQDDPAMDAEPVSWDGKGLVNSVSPNLFQDYELIQHTWKEDAVT
ncbi:uncharacterized protein LOC121865072 [Homarus americanus]|uniref:Uncharacterized protein n=1 Tax=Homarus americanus TaxID=6706 RepID=A0A8J5N0I0_HOMAM|nr:uncharacterized protein LOC121865072 [Homarus americanus]KAG7170136.1 hypothetical protein Hamer_G012377 [Homarus americanus]